MQGKLVITYCRSNRQHFIESHMYRDQIKYHKEFMRAQDIASNLAKKYNEALSQVQTHFRDSLHDIDWVYWASEYILPSVFYVDYISISTYNFLLYLQLVLGIEDNGIKKSFLIEKLLDGKYKKFNNNLGHVDNDTSNW